MSGLQEGRSSFLLDWIIAYIAAEPDASAESLTSRIDVLSITAGTRA